ncbi:flavin reductase [Paraglaciecola sp. L3A3]|uniref:flavin reductase n=1 Tax=Paraglaciecola sp. L3A3 TaxID=2686358 RepID=UPI00131C4DEF|nr:flavin reductase [Paraglaciecola sp. L3A3]
MSEAKELPPETSTTCVTEEEFRQGMSALSGTVNIVTTGSAENKAGFTATAVCSVSDNPPTLLVCLNRGASVHQAFAETKSLVVNTLDAGQDDLSNLFGGKTPMAERFTSNAWETLITGSPILSNAAVSFDCIVTDIKSVATHDVIFCKVVGIKQKQQAGALLYFQRNYHHLDNSRAPV